MLQQQYGSLECVDLDVLMLWCDAQLGCTSSWVCTSARQCAMCIIHRLLPNVTRVALALDAHMQPEAASALGGHLAKHASGAVQQAGAEGAALQLSSQQFAMAAQMYAIEVL